jgi:hypothetical protein
MEALYSQTYFCNDGQVTAYLKSKLCGSEGFLPHQVFDSWLQFKKSKSKDGKSREKLLIKKYRLSMQNCLSNWANLFFYPNFRNSLDASKQKLLWLRNKNSSLSRFWQSRERINNESTIFGMTEFVG